MNLPMRVGLLGVVGLVAFGVLLTDAGQNFLNSQIDPCSSTRFARTRSFVARRTRLGRGLMGVPVGSRASVCAADIHYFQRNDISILNIAKGGQTTTEHLGANGNRAFRPTRGNRTIWGSLDMNFCRRCRNCRVDGDENRSQKKRLASRHSKGIR